MIITRDYARKLIREGKASYLSVVDGEPKDSSIRYLERTSTTIKDGVQCVVIVRHDKCRADHYIRRQK